MTECIAVTGVTVAAGDNRCDGATGGSQMSQTQELDTARALEVARAEFDAWIAAAPRPEAARRWLEPDAALHGTALARVEAVLAHPRPASATRRWICESMRGWAPLEVLFPTHDYRGHTGLSGELPLHLPLLVEREYGHVLGIARDLADACELLRTDRDRLALQLAVAAALLPLLGATEDEDANWLAELRRQSLAMAEYLHRSAIGLAQILPEHLVMNYAAAIARTQRAQRDACQRAA
jgi:hypothetical protein